MQKDIIGVGSLVLLLGIFVVQILSYMHTLEKHRCAEIQFGDKSTAGFTQRDWNRWKGMSDNGDLDASQVRSDAQKLTENEIQFVLDNITCIY